MHQVAQLMHTQGRLVTTLRAKDGVAEPRREDD